MTDFEITLILLGAPFLILFARAVGSSVPSAPPRRRVHATIF